MADQKITQLTETTTPAIGDMFEIVTDPTGSPINKKIQRGNLAIKPATKVVAANDSISKYLADYTCDGAADEAEINAAIVALGATGGKVVLLEGTYTLAADIVLASKVELSGMGAGSTILDFANGNYQVLGTSLTNVIIKDLQVKRSADAQGNIKFATCTRAKVFDVEVAAGTTTNTTGILLTAVVDCLIKGCYIHGFNTATGYGISLAGSTPSRIVDCVFDSNYRSIGLLNSVHSSVVNCSITNVEQYGIRAYDYCDVLFCYISHAGNIGLNAEGSHNRIIGNYFAGVGNGVYLGEEPDTGVVIGNFFDGSDLYFPANTKGTVVTGNYFAANANISGNLAEYGANNIFGNLGASGAAASIDITKEVRSVVVKNTSGGALAEGDVVVLKAAAAGNEVTTTTTQGDDKVLGMAAEAINDNAYGRIQVLGKTTMLKVDGTTDVAIGDFLGTFTTAKIAMKAAAGDMVFAIALEAYATNDSAGVIDALLITPRQI